MYGLHLLGLLAPLVVLGLSGRGVNAQGYCEIDIDAVPETFNPSLLVSAETREMLYPEIRNGVRLLSISPGTNMVAACPGKRNSFQSSNEKVLDVSCNAGKLTLTQGAYSQVTSFEELGCQRRPRAYARRFQNSRCGQKGVRYEIGFPIRTGFYVPLIHFCFDVEEETTEFTFHKVLGRAIGAKIVDSSRPGFRAAGLFNLDVHGVYKKKSQMALFSEMLGTNEHLSGKGQHYLARGHMAPDSDFFYAAEQDATYFYGNVVPQWQAFNNGNWKRIEFAIRELAEKHQATFDIWTGSYGVLQMPDENGNSVSMFLGLADGKKKIPVPALMWKVIRNPVIHRAVAIVAINDVRGEGSSEDISLMEPPCTDVCDQLSWIDFNTKDIRRGLTYCCYVSDLRDKIPTLPDLGNVSLLDD